MSYHLLLLFLWAIHCTNRKMIEYHSQLKVPYNEAHLQTQLLYEYFGNDTGKSNVTVITQQSTSLTLEIKNGIKSVSTKDIVLHIECLFQDSPNSAYNQTWRHLSRTSINISYGVVEQRIDHQKIDYVKVGTQRHQNTSLYTTLLYSMKYQNEKHLQLDSDEYTLTIKMIRAPLEKCYPSDYHYYIHLLNLGFMFLINNQINSIEKDRNAQILSFSILQVAGSLIASILTYKLYIGWGYIFVSNMYKFFAFQTLTRICKRKNIGLLHIVCLGMFLGEFSTRSLIIYTVVHLYSLPHIHTDLLLQNKSTKLFLSKIARILINLFQIHFLKQIAEQTPTDACPYIFQDFHLSKWHISQQMLLLVYFNAVLSLDFVVEGIFKANNSLAKWFNQKFTFAKIHLQGKEKVSASCEQKKNV